MSPIFARAALVAVVVLATLAGCVRRTMTITTEPPQALVFLNDQEVGRSEVSTDFLWYGDYDVVIRMEGYKTLKTHWKIDPPWYQILPFDFFAEVLWPGRIHDQHFASFELEPQEYPASPELAQRAEELRRQVSPIGP